MIIGLSPLGVDLDSKIIIDSTRLVVVQSTERIVRVAGYERIVKIE